MDVMILVDSHKQIASHSQKVILNREELRHNKKKLIKHIFRYRHIQLAVHRLDIISKPFILAIMARLLGWGRCEFIDDAGGILTITPLALLRLGWQYVQDHLGYKQILEQLEADVDTLMALPPVKHTLDRSATPYYFRTDLVYGLTSGGSVGHIAGVLNNLDKFTGKPVFITSDFIPTVRDDIVTQIILPADKYWNITDLPSLYYNQRFTDTSSEMMRSMRPGFIYQRYALNNFSGVKLAQQYNVPLVLEYNSSEVWVTQNWMYQKTLKHQSLSEKIELLNAQAADVIVVVSQPLKDELIERGMDGDKILVNPNGVNPDVYSPQVDGTAIREKFAFDDKVVLGYIGTFGPWHGTDLLTEAFGLFLQENPNYLDNVRLLMIGAGEGLSTVRSLISQYDLENLVILAGRVPQIDGPNYLAACDLLMSPHVPNTDGSRFFGSPTKLFEYMAMGKGIVASDLEQIGEILKHDETAWMVKPGDVHSLMDGIKTMVDDKVRRDRLGQAARQQVLEQHTWKIHTQKIIEKLKSRVQA